MPRLYVGRLNNRVTERDLKRFFDGYGKIREIFMKNGYAFLVSLAFFGSVVYLLCFSSVLLDD